MGRTTLRDAIVLAIILLLGAMVTVSFARETFTTTAAAPALSSQGVDAVCDALIARVGSMPGNCRLGIVRENGVNTLKGSTHVDGDLNVGKRMFFGDATMNPSGSTANNTDSYFLEKVTTGRNASHLRLTLNDDADESLQVWGGSCATGNCGGPGRQQHRLDATGNAWHARSVEAPDVRAATIRTRGALSLSGDCLRWTTPRGDRQMCFQRDSTVRLQSAGATMHPPGATDVGRTNTLRILSSGPNDGSPNGLSLGVRGSGRFGGNHAVIETIKGGVAGHCDIRLRTNGADALVIDGNTRDVRVAGRLCVGGTCVTEAQLRALLQAAPQPR